MQNRNIFVGSVACVMILLGVGVIGWVFTWDSLDVSKPTNMERVEVVVSLFPLAEFARAVGGEDVNVVLLPSAGQEPHSFEPSPNDVLRTLRADVFFSNGFGVDAWADRLAVSAEQEGVRVASLAQDLATIESNEALGHVDEEHAEEEGHAFDPHVWLVPALAAKQVERIRDVLIEEDPIRVDAYRLRAQTYLDELRALDVEYQTGLAHCDVRTVITSHAAFTYLAEVYRFEVEPIAGLSPEEEPSAGRLAELSNLIQETGIKYVFFESLVSDALAQTLAKETGARTLIFSPIEGLSIEEEQFGASYLSLMRQNLVQLRTAMICR